MERIKSSAKRILNLERKKEKKQTKKKQRTKNDSKKNNQLKSENTNNSATDSRKEELNKFPLHSATNNENINNLQAFEKTLFK